MFYENIENIHSYKIKKMHKHNLQKSHKFCNPTSIFKKLQTP